MKKDVTLEVDGLKIKGQLYLPRKKAIPYPTVILCHGVPSGSVDPSDGGYPALARTICQAGLAVFTFNFRGTGVSEGNFDIAGWTRDLAATVNYIWDLPEISDSQLYLVGFSAGASISIYLAAQDKRISGVAACACPASFRAVTDAGQIQATLDHFRRIAIIRDPDFPTSVDEWVNNFRKINALHNVQDISPRPLLLVHGSQDKVVPVTDCYRLYEKAGEPKQMVIIEAAEHRLRRNVQAVDAVIKWLKDQAC
jgi:uncharacterized protein